MTASRTKRSQMIILTFLGVSALLNIVLSVQSWMLDRATIAATTGFETLKAGSRLAPLELDSREGKTMLSLTDASPPTVVYVFVRGSYWTEQNGALFKALSDRIRHRWRVIGIEVRSPGSTGVPPEITKWGGQSFDAIYSTDATLRERIRVPKAPATIAVVGGRVTHIWQGIYINDRRVNLERYFQVSLPERTF